MISAEVFCETLRERGFTVATGVPCSHFGGPIALLERTPGHYLAAANEGAALAVAAGVALAGGRPYVMLQNSGLGNLINPLTSLVMTYGIPVLTFVSLRGWPDPAGDEPQHEVMGPTTHAILDTLGVTHRTLTADHDEGAFEQLLDDAGKTLDHGRPAFVLVGRGAIGKAAATSERPVDGGMDSAAAVTTVARVAGHALLIATTGYTSREVFAVAHRPGNFYMQGSMGHAASVALGVAQQERRRPVIVLDGDGAVIMHLGALSMIGNAAPPNLIHVVLDNGAHESTGGQRTTSATTAFDRMALAAGYRSAQACRSTAELEAVLTAALASPGPHLFRVHTRLRGGAVPPRATTVLSPQAIAAAFAADVTAARAQE